MADNALSDAEFDSMFGPAGDKTSGTTALQEGRPLADGEFDQVFGPESKVPSQDILYGEAAPWVKHYENKWQAGEASVTRGVAGMRALSGSVQYEAIRDDVGEQKLKGEIDSFQRNLSPWDVRGWVGEAAQSLPFMREVISGGAKGAAGGAVLGAGTAFVAGQLGPQVALPEELATIPGGAALGARWGYRVGAFTTSAKLMSGQLYLDLRDKGITHDTARVAAVAGGAIEGLIESAQINQLGGMAKREFVNQLGTQAGKNVLGRFILDYVKDVGLEVGQEELQTVTELVAQGVSGYVENNQNALLSKDEVEKKLLETLIQSTQASVVLAGGSRIAGATVGKTVDSVQSISSRLLRQQQMVESIQGAEGAQRGAEVATGLAQRLAAGRMNLAQAARIVAEAMAKPQITEEQKQETMGQSVDEILDSLTEPATDQDVKPLIGRVLKTIGEALEQPDDSNGTTDATGIPGPDGNAIDPGAGESLGVGGAVEPGRAFGEGAVSAYQTAGDTVYSAVSGPSIPNTELPTPELQARAKQVDSDIAGIDRNIRELEKAVDDRDYVGKQQARDGAQDAYDKAVRVTERLEKKFNNKELKGRENQQVLDKLEKAYADEQAALKTLKAAERKFRAVDPRKTSTTAFENKLEKLYTQRATLETERALLQEGLLSPEEIKRSQVKMTAGQISSLRATAVSRILKAFAKGQREGATFTRAEVKDIQQEVVSLIRESELSGKDKGKFLSSIRNIQTESQLLRALPKIQQRIDALVDLEQRRQVKRQMARLLKQSQLAKSGKRAVGKFGSADTQRVLDTYRRALEDPEWRYETIARGIDLMADNVQKALTAMSSKDSTITDYEGVTSRDILETLIAQRVGEFETKSVADQQAILAEIQEIMQTGRAEKLEQKLAAAAQREIAIAGALESIQGIKPTDTLNKANSELSLNTKRNALKRLVRTMFRQTNSWDGLLIIASQHDQNNELRKIASVKEPIRNEFNSRKAFQEKFVDTIIKAVGKDRREVLDRMVSGSKKETMGSYVNQDGENVNLIISRNEAIKLWNQMSDPELEAGLKEGNQYTFPEDVSNTQKSTYTLLEETLTPQDKAMAAGVKKFYSDYYDRINKEWEDETGASLGLNPEYSGYARRMGTQESGTAAFFHEQFSRSTVKPSSTISRVSNALGLELQDAFTDGLKHVQDFEHWIAWRRTDRIVRGIFANKDVRNAIELKYGKGMLRTIDDRYNDMIGTRQEQLYDALKWVDTIRLNAGTAFVGGKTITFFKQMSAITNFMLDVSPVEMAEGMIDFAMHPKKAIAIMETSPLLQARFETFDRDLMEALNRDDISRFKRHPKLLEIMMWGTKYGDRATIWAGGWAVYKAALKKTGDHEQAIRAFEDSFNSTQQSGTPDSMSQLERSGQLGKILTLFVKQNLQMLEREGNAIRKLLAIPNAQNLAEAARTVAVIHTSAAIFQAVGSSLAFLGDDEEEQKEELIKILRAFILGPFAGLGPLGDIINAAGTVVTNWVFNAKEHTWEPKFLPFEVGTHTLSLFKRTFALLTKDGIELEDLFKIMKDYARGPDLLLPPQLGGGVPKEPIVKFTEWLLVDPEDVKRNRKK